MKPMTLGETRIIDGVSYTLVLFTQIAYNLDDDERAVMATGEALGLFPPDAYPTTCAQCADASNDTCPAETRLCGRGSRPVYVVRTEAVPLLALEGVLE